MSLEFNYLSEGGLFSRSPLRRNAIKELAPNAVAFEFSQRAPSASVIQTNLNTWQVPGGKRHMVCVSTMREGCFYDCGFCDGVLGGKNLTAEEILYQVWFALTSRYVNVCSVQQLEINTFGIGEPFVNKAVIEAFQILDDQLDGASFIVSTHGPRSGMPVFEGLVKLAKLGLRLGLQVSVDFLSDSERFLYMDKTDPEGKKSWTLQELSWLGQEWIRLTGGAPIANFVVSSGMPNWTGREFEEVMKLFPAPWVIKLSYESKAAEVSRDEMLAAVELDNRERGLANLGRVTERFILPGTNVLGGGCGALAPQLVKIG